MHSSWSWSYAVVVMGGPAAMGLLSLGLDSALRRRWDCPHRDAVA